MNKIKFNYGMRYELSSDCAGLLKYLTPTTFYHIHSNEMTSLERRKHKAMLVRRYLN